MNIVNIQILFFGSLKSHFGNQLQLSVPKGMVLGHLIEILIEKDPASSPILASCRIAVDSMLEKEDFILERSHEIAILPPFSGG